LLNNNPGDAEFVHRFENSRSWNDASENGEGLNGIEPPVAQHSSFMGGANENDDTFFGAELNLESFFGDLESQVFCRTASIQFEAQDLKSAKYAALEPRTKEMRDMLSRVAKCREVWDCGIAPHDLLDVIQLLTPPKIEEFTSLFFRQWHRHAPIVHEGTFDTLTASIPLILSIVSIGGMYSKDNADIFNLKLLFDIIETYIFDTVFAKDEYQLGIVIGMDGKDDDAMQRQLEDFQGAYLIVVVQYWAGNAKAKRRARQDRFTKIVAVCGTLSCMHS
jgi:hypothetical protein